MLENEIWKPIIGYERLYEISNLMHIKSFNYRKKIDSKIIPQIIDMINNKISGKIISEKFKISQITISKIRKNKEKYLNIRTILKPRIDNNGYLYVDLYKNKIYKRFRVHELMLLHFVGPKPFPKAVCRHLDGNPTNSLPYNIAWGTMSENSCDSIKHGTRYQPNNNGTKNGLSKLNDNKVKEIRKLYSEGISQKELSIRFNVGITTICSVVNYKTWKHIKEK